MKIINFFLVLLLGVSNAVASELEDMAKEDQKARSGKINWKVLVLEDAARRTRVKEILASNQNLTANEYTAAALMMQNGTELADYQAAFELSRKALELDPNHGLARWLTCANEDRILLRTGKPQVWATHIKTKMNPENTYLIYDLYDFDRNAKSDLQRAYCGLKSLKEMDNRLMKMATMPNTRDQYVYWKTGVMNSKMDTYKMMAFFALLVVCIICLYKIYRKRKLRRQITKTLDL